jgi:hypothetical protein
MADEDIINNIDALIAEERRLRSGAPGEGLDDTARQRLQWIEQRLDQCWDLLRQRRARAEFDEDPDQAQARPISEVESYRQ